MERASLELRECLEEDCQEGMDVLRRVLGSLDSLAEVGVREADANTGYATTSVPEYGQHEGKRAYGWSRKNMFVSAFHEYEFQIVPLLDTLFMSILHGPVRTLSAS